MAEHWVPGGGQGQVWKEACPAEPGSSPGSPWSVSKASEVSGGDPANGASWAILAARAAQQQPWPPQGGLEGGSWAPGVAEAGGGGGGSSARSAGGSSRAASPTFADTARLQAVVQHQQQQLEAAGYRRGRLHMCTVEWNELGVLCRLHQLPPSCHACPPSSFVRMPWPIDSCSSHSALACFRAGTSPHTAACACSSCRAGQAEDRVVRLEQLAIQLASDQTVLQVKRWLALRK